MPLRQLFAVTEGTVTTFNPDRHGIIPMVEFRTGPPPSEPPEQEPPRVRPS